MDNAKHRVAREEIFGPVLAIIPFETGNEEEALRIANDTPYGLASFVQTGSRERAERVAKRLRAGYVRFNGDAPNYGTPKEGHISFSLSHNLLPQLCTVRSRLFRRGLR